MSEKEIPLRQIKNLIINPRVQLKILATFSGLFLLTVGTLYSVFYLFFWKFTQKAIDVGIPDGHVFFHFLEGQKHNVDSLFLVLVVLNFALLILTGLILSHRIAGPIVKLKNHLSTLDQESEDFKLREKDCFNDICSSVNDLRKRMK